MNGDHQPLGKLWVSHFLKRNPRVASIVGRKIEVARAAAATPAQVLAFLELFERTRQRLNIQMEDIYNMDETGVALGVCTNTQVLASSSKKKAYVQSPEDREWVSVIECVSATGCKLRCVSIFKGQALQSTWFPASVPNWLYTTSENGWTSNAIGSEWLQRVFLPETATALNRPRMLIMDGHGSHVSVDFLWTCKQHQVELLFLPAHSSHVLQPLDLTGFSVVKSKYRRQILELSALDDAAPVKKERFITCYHYAREEGLTERVIRAGWRAAGICPFNPEQVIRSSQVSHRAITPPASQQPQLPIERILITPQKPQDLYYAQLELQKSEIVTRRTRIVLHKAGKALSFANTRAAALQAENLRLKHQLSTTQSTKPRKRVYVDPNQRFADIENIMTAINESAAEEARRSKTSAEDAAKIAAAAAAAATLESMCTSWQLSL
jgi:hypothetical protein